MGETKRGRETDKDQNIVLYKETDRQINESDFRGTEKERQTERDKKT